MTSIRLRLLLLFLGLTLVVWLTTVASTYLQTSHEVEEIYDAHLSQSAEELLTFAAHEYAEQTQAPQGTGPDGERLQQEIQQLARHHSQDEYAPYLSFRVWVQQDLLLHSADALRETPPGADGFSERRTEQGPWRVFTLRDPVNGFTVEVAEQYDLRRKIIDEVARASVYPALITFPLLALVAWVAVGSGLAPLRQLANQMRHRSPESMAPVSMERTPDEVKPLVSALNRLLVRLGATLERERRFTADASHELRTPLASLKVQAQVARRTDDPDTRQRALGQIVEGVDRAHRLVEQLLTIARLDPAQTDATRARMDLNRVSAEVVAQLAPEAMRKSIELGLTEGEVGEVQGRADVIAILLRNLIDNAVRYTPAGGRVEVRVSDRDGDVCLEVADSGPGIPPHERERVFDRFYRGLGHGQTGCGLGLSIVQRIAELHRIRLRLDDSPFGGLSVFVGFQR